MSCSDIHGFASSPEKYRADPSHSSLLHVERRFQTGINQFVTITKSKRTNRGTISFSGLITSFSTA